MNSTMKEINKLFKEFQNNKWSFPSTWSNERFVSEDLIFRTYFDDGREYFVLEIKNADIEINHRRDGWSVEHPIGKPVTSTAVLKTLRLVKSYLENTPDKQEEARIEELQDKKNQIRGLKRELKRLTKEGE